MTLRTMADWNAECHLHFVSFTLCVIYTLCHLHFVSFTLCVIYAVSQKGFYAECRDAKLCDALYNNSKFENPSVPLK